MAYMMVHLLVADRWAAKHPEYRNCPEFYYGAIAPDAIHVRDGNDKSRKDEIHLHNWQSLHVQEVLDYWRARQSPFDIGYGVHVLTDAQWVPRYTRLLPGLFEPDGKLNLDRYFVDNIVTDFKLLNETPRAAEMLELLERAETPADHPLLTAYEISRWRELMVEAYRGECLRQGPARYIDVPYVRAFVENSIAQIDAVYKSSRGAD